MANKSGARPGGGREGTIGGSEGRDDTGREDSPAPPVTGALTFGILGAMNPRHIYQGHYLAVFTSNKTSPKWQAWYAKTEEEKRATDEAGLAALAAWDEAHRDVIVYQGGALGPTKRAAEDGVTDVVNEMTVFMVVRADSHEAAAQLFVGHPHCTIFPCDAVEVMPLLGG